MKHSLETLKALAVTAESNAKSWIRAAAANEAELAKYQSYVTQNRANAATEQAKADDFRVAIALLEQAGKPAKWGVFFLNGLQMVRSEDFPASYATEAEALASLPTDWQSNYQIRRLDNA